MQPKISSYWPRLRLLVGAVLVAIIIARIATKAVKRAGLETSPTTPAAPPPAALSTTES